MSGWAAAELAYLAGCEPQVKFPPATFCMVFACRPLLSLLMNQLNKPIRERSVTWNFRFIFCLKRRKCMRLIGNKLLIYMDNNFSRQAKSFLEVKLRRLRRKTYESKYDTHDKNLPTCKQFYHSQDWCHDIECKKETCSQQMSYLVPQKQILGDLTLSPPRVTYRFCSV